MNRKQLIRHLKTSRLLIITLIFAQVLTTIYITNDIIQNKETQLHQEICNQELIPLTGPIDKQNPQAPFVLLDIAPFEEIK